MKLNNRRTILVGLAFLSFCTFWQMYDSVMTLILTDTLKLNRPSMPFIEGGTGLAAILMNLIPLLDDRYAANPSTGTLVLFIMVLGLLMVSMGTYR